MMRDRLKKGRKSKTHNFPNKGLDVLASTPDAENFCPACNKSAVTENPAGHHQKCGGEVITVGSARSASAGLRLVICGQIRGGKNGVKTTRKGKRYPDKKWAAWRDDAVRGIRAQLPNGFTAFDQPVNVRLEYVAGDKRRRDNPAIVDSIWHCLEKAGVVSDDTLLWPAESSRSYDKDSPRAVITFL